MTGFSMEVIADNEKRPCQICGRMAVLRPYDGKSICFECWKGGHEIGDRLRALAAECDKNLSFSAIAAVITKNSTLHLFCDAPQDEEEARAQVMRLFINLRPDEDQREAREIFG